MLTSNYLWQEMPSERDYRIELPLRLRVHIEALKPNDLSAQMVSESEEAVAESLSLFNPWVADWVRHLHLSPGFVVPVLPAHWSDAQLRFGYACICRALGALNNRYGYFFDVKDYGLDYKKEAIPVSKTRDGTGYHTDSSAAEYYPDVVGLLCLHPAPEGGDSLIANAANLYEFLARKHPSLLSVLRSPLLRDVITPGTEQNVEAILQNKIPVFAEKEGKLVFRYMRFWTERAYEKTWTVPPDKLKEALDQVDAFCNEEKNYLQFRMERGDILLVNNTFLCHNRTAFNEPPGLPARLMVRAWMNWA